MTRTIILFISFIVSTNCLAQNQERTHEAAFGIGRVNYKSTDATLIAPYLNVTSDWKNGLNSLLGFQVQTIGNEFAFSVKVGLKKALSEKTTLNSTTTLSTGAWQPNFSQQIGFARKVSDKFSLNGSLTAYLGLDRKPILVASFGGIKSFGKSSVTLKAFNQISKVGALNPTLSASYIYASSNGNVFAVFAQGGYQSVLEDLLGAGTASLKQIGGGAWCKVNFSKNYYLLVSMDINSYSSLKANFSSSSFKFSFHTK